MRAAYHLDSETYVNAHGKFCKTRDHLTTGRRGGADGRTQPQKRATIARVRHTYVCFNFKAALLSDEKQERLVSVLMDAHSGSRVPQAEPIEMQDTAVTPDPLLESLPDAPLRWQPKDGPPLKFPLDAVTLSALLARAETAVLPPTPRGKTGSKPKPQPKARLQVKAAPKPPPGPQPIFMGVVFDQSSVTAYLMGKREKQIALRIWRFELDEGGILCKCHCEKGERCPASNMISRPSELEPMDKQMLNEVHEFAREYKLPVSKIHYFQVSSLSGEPFPVPKLRLTGLWQNEEALAHARQVFADRYWKRRR